MAKSVKQDMLFDDFKKPSIKMEENSGDTDKLNDQPDAVTAEPAPEKRGPGRPPLGFKRKYMYYDLTGLDEYVTFRAKKEKKNISEFLRSLVLKDVSEHKELFNLIVDEPNERLVKELENMGIYL